MTILKDLFWLAVLFLAIWIAFYLGTRHETLQDRIVRYDCSLTEFAPDIPNDVRDECRRRRLEAYNQQRLKETE